MTVFKKYNIRAVMLSTLWFTLGTASLVILIAAVKKSNVQRYNGTNIQILGVTSNYFIDKKDIGSVISRYNANNNSTTIASFDLQKIESALEKEIWIKDAELFFDNNGVLQADIHEREPIARIFSLSGESFYIDSSLMVLPLSEKFSARLPVFTGFPIAARILSKADSILLKSIKDVAVTIKEDGFLMAMIEQVDITWQRTFELIPKLGDQVIVFGDGKDAEEKFRKLKLFYKNVIVRTGWTKYSQVNLQYSGQVVAKIRGADDITSDSLRTVQLMQLIAENTEKQVQDSLKNIVPEINQAADSAIIQRSIQRDEEPEAADTKPANHIDEPAVVAVNDAKPATAMVLKKMPVAKPVVASPKPKVEKTVVKKSAQATVKVTQQPVKQKTPNKVERKLPKAVMPKSN